MSKLSPLENKGTAMGIYSTAQFIGAFIGGILGGLMYTQFALSGVFIAGVVLTLIWLVVVMPMRPPRHLINRIIHVDNLSPENADNIAQQINAIEGVVETIVVVEEQVAYVKFAPELINAEALDAFSPQSS